MKTCFKCGIEKEVTEFYRHPMMADGRLGKCKECTKKDVSGNYRSNIKHYKQYEQSRMNLPHRIEARIEYAKTPQGKIARAKGGRKWTENNIVKKAAQIMVNNAVRDKRLMKFPCEVCGSTTRIHGHHDDYSKPLSVRWLCPKHHAEHHKRMRND